MGVVTESARIAELRADEAAVLEGLDLWVSMRSILMKTYGAYRRFKTPAEEDIESLVDAFVRSLEVEERDRSAVIERGDALRAASVGVARLDGTKAASGSEAILKLLEPLVKVLKKAKEGTAGEAKRSGRIRNFFDGWRMLPSLGWGGEDDDIREAIKIEWARLRVRDESPEGDGETLGDLEREIIKAVRDHGPIKGIAIAKRVYKAHDHIRKPLASLKRRKYIFNDNDRRGYYVK